MDDITCTDGTHLKITMYIPYQLVERAEKYANKNGNTVTGVVIEALDALLRGRKVD